MGGVAIGWGWPPWTRSGPRKKAAGGGGGWSDRCLHPRRETGEQQFTGKCLNIASLVWSHVIYFSQFD